MSKGTLFFLLIPFFKPAGLEKFAGLNELFIGWKIASFALLTLCFFWAKFVLRRNLYLNKGWFALLVYWLIYNYNNITYVSFSMSVLTNAIASLFILLVFLYQGGLNEPDKLLGVLSKLFKILVWSQFVSIAVVRFYIPIFGFSDGNTGDYIYLMGTDNYSAFSLLPMIGLICFYDAYRKSPCANETFYLYLGSYTIVYFAMQSYSAAFAGLGFFVVYSLKTPIVYFLENKITVKNMLIVFGGLIMALTFVTYSVWLKDFFISLGKDPTISGRTHIWAGAVNLISQRPLLGWGNVSSSDIENYVLFGTNHAHNFFLDIALETGVVGAGFFLFFLLYPVDYLQEKMEKKLFRMLKMGLFAQFIMWTFDFYPANPSMYCFVGIFYYFKIKTECLENSYACRN